MYECQLNYLFQTVSLKHVKWFQFFAMTENGNEALEEYFSKEYVDMIDIFSKGDIDDIDEMRYLKIYYLLFLQTNIKLSKV